MSWAPFHHPDISLPVIARKLSAEFLDMLLEFDLRALVRPFGRTWYYNYPNRTAYEQAIHRLRRNGLIAKKEGTGSDPILVLTKKGEAQRPPSLRPTRFWNKSWNGIWYVLVYDIPEKNRSYRDNLRSFLKRQRMGW